MYYTSMIAMIGQLGTIAIALQIGRLSDQHGRKPFIYMACAVMATVYILFLFAPPLGPTLIIGLAYGMGNGCFLTVDYALAVDTLPNKHNVAKDLGLWGVSAFVGTACGPIVLGPLLHAVGILTEGGTWARVLGHTEQPAQGSDASSEGIQYGASVALPLHLSPPKPASP